MVLISIFVFWLFFREHLTIERLASHESTLRDWFQASPFLFYVCAFLLYLLVAGLALPGAAALSLVIAWFFGFWPAIILISFASTAGATICFLLSRFLFRGTIERRFGDRVATFDRNFEQDGAFYLFTVRMIPAIPFFLINLMSGLTKIRAWTFWWVSQLGMLPGTVVFVYAGSSFPRLNDLAENGLQGILNFKIIAAFVFIGLFPWFARMGLRAIFKN